MPKVEFKRVQTDAEVENIDIKDGQLIYTGTGKTYMDYGSERIPTGSGGSSVEVDTEMSDISENAVQNKVIKEYVDDQVSSIPEEVVIDDEEPTDPDVKLWIDTGEIAQAHTEITNEYSTSTGLGYSANYVNNLHTYSTDEIRIGTWIDGKPLYRKVISTTTPSQVDTGTNIYDATSLNIDRLINLSFNFKGDFNEYATASNVIVLFTRISSGTRNIGCTCTIQNYCDKQFYLVLEYTKTTD